MSDPFLGEIKVISFPFAPQGWAFCDGQVLPISQNQALFTVLGNRFGGDGITFFALPDLRGRMPIHPGQGFAFAAHGGEAAHRLTVAEMPVHNHPARAAAVASTPSPKDAVWAPATGETAFAKSPDSFLSTAAIGVAGGDVPHENQPPYLVLSFVIALRGIFPSRS